MRRSRPIRSLKLQAACRFALNQALTTSDFERIFDRFSNASVTVQYKALMATEGVNIEFTDSGIKRIAEAAWQVT